MTYVYHCPHCDKDIEIEKSISEASRREFCGCGDEMVSFSGSKISRAIA